MDPQLAILKVLNGTLPEAAHWLHGRPDRNGRDRMKAGFSKSVLVTLIMLGFDGRVVHRQDVASRLECFPGSVHKVVTGLAAAGLLSYRVASVGPGRLERGCVYEFAWSRIMAMPQMELPHSSRQKADPRRIAGDETDPRAVKARDEIAAQWGVDLDLVRACAKSPAARAERRRFYLLMREHHPRIRVNHVLRSVGLYESTPLHREFEREWIEKAAAKGVVVPPAKRRGPGRSKVNLREAVAA